MAYRYKKRLTKRQRELVFCALRGLGYPSSMISDGMIREYHADQYYKEMTRSFDEMEDEMRQEYLASFVKKYGNEFRMRPSVRKTYLCDEVELVIPFVDVP